MSLLTPYKNLPREVYALALARAVSALGAFVYPFLTLTLTTRLQMSPKEAGGVVALMGVTGLLGSAFGGWLSDRRDKVQLILMAQIGSALSLCVAGFVHCSLTLIAPLMLATLSLSMIRPASSALIMELTKPEQRARAFSLGHLGTNLGFSVGPLIAGFLFQRAPAWIFWGDGLTTALAGLIVWRFVHGRGAPEAGAAQASRAEAHTLSSSLSTSQESSREAAMEGSVWRVLRERPQLIAYAGFALLTSLGYAQVTFSLPITLHELVGERSADLFGWVMSGNGLFVLLLTPLLTRRAEATPHLAALCRAGLCFGVGFGVLALTPSAHLSGYGWGLPLVLGVSVALWTAGEIYAMNHGSAFVAQETPSSHRGRVNGVLPVVMGLTRSAAPVLSGFLLAHISLELFWGLTGALSLLAALGFRWMRARWGFTR